MNLSMKMSVSIATERTHSIDLKIELKLITQNSHLSKYFNKIPLNYSYYGFKYCPNTGLCEIYHEYRY